MTGRPTPLGASAAEGGMRLTATGASGRGLGRAGGEGKSERYRSRGLKYRAGPGRAPEALRRWGREFGKWGRASSVGTC